MTILPQEIIAKMEAEKKQRELLVELLLLKDKECHYCKNTGILLRQTDPDDKPDEEYCDCKIGQAKQEEEPDNTEKKETIEHVAEGLSSYW